MNVLDRGRIGRAVNSYDMWLDLRGVPGRRRRGLRRELRANLGDAAERVGAREAVRALGSPRRMAAEVSPADPHRPHWKIGLWAGSAALILVLLAELFAALAWADGAAAAETGKPVSGSMTLFPGSELTYDSAGGGVSLSLGFGWLCLAVGLLAFVIAARPWRIFSRSCDIAA